MKLRNSSRSHYGSPCIKTENDADKTGGYTNDGNVLPRQQCNVLSKMSLVRGEASHSSNWYLFVDSNKVVGNLLPILIDPDLSSRIVLECGYRDGENTNQTAGADKNLDAKNANAF